MAEEKYYSEEGEEVSESGEVIPKKKGFFKGIGQRVKGSYGYGMIQQYREKAPERRTARIERGKERRTERMGKLKGHIEELKLQKQEAKLIKEKRGLKGGVSLSGSMPSFAPSGSVMPGGGVSGLGKVPQIGGGFGQPSMGIGSPFGGMPTKERRKSPIKQKPKRRKKR